MTTERLAMFPLGTVLFPGEAIPLQVFEPRYQVLVARCLEGRPEFGIALNDNSRHYWSAGVAIYFR